jgi:hypothetical protein
MNVRVRWILLRLRWVAVVLLGTWLIKYHSAWSANSPVPSTQPMPRFGGPLAIAAFVVLGMFLLGIAWVLFSPWYHRTADEAMGLGCVAAMGWAVAGALVLLTLAVWFQLAWAVALIGWTSMMFGAVALFGVGVAIYEAVTKKRV